MLQSKIEGLSRVNNEIITRIQSKKSFHSFLYKIKEVPNEKIQQFAISEEKMEYQMEKVLEDWKCSKIFLDIPDLFNMKINYSVTTFTELTTLNTSLIDLSKKYIFFQESPNAVEPLKQILNNLELIQTCLGEIDQLLVTPVSKQAHYEKRISLINADLMNLSKEINVVFWSNESKCFNYTNDFDKNGVFYWLGTKKGKQEYQNPCDLVEVKVKTCTWFSGLNNKYTIQWNVEGKSPQCYSHDSEKQPWVEIEVVNHFVVPKYYTLRGDDNTNTGYTFRNWRLEGSVNGKDWETLKEHNNDTAMKIVPSASASWPIVGITKSFKFFRIQKTGPNGRSENNGNNDHYLMMQGFEIYGVISK